MMEMKAGLSRRETLAALGAFALAPQASPLPPLSPRSPTSAADIGKLEAAFDFVRARNARDYAISGARAIDEAKYLRVGGIEQWVTIRGENRDNPVALLLHGGPGDATNPWGYAGFRPWLKSYT